MKLVVSTAAVLAAALCFIPSALAANIAPNPSFTTDCSGVPCQWEETNTGTGGIGNRQFVVLTRDTSTFPTGSGPASLRVQTGPLFDQGAQTACLTAGVGNGTWSISFKYLVSDADVDWISAMVLFYADNVCDPSQNTGPIDILISTVDPAGAFPAGWQTVAAVNDTISGNPQSARIVLNVRPTGPCTDNSGCFAIANFDDLNVNSPVPTAVRFQSAAAYRSPAGVVLRWRTAAEIGTLGFNVYRERAGNRQRVNRTLILGGRAFYSFVDRLAPRKTKVRYWIEEVALDGRRSWHGPLGVPF